MAKTYNWMPAPRHQAYGSCRCARTSELTFAHQSLTLSLITCPLGEIERVGIPVYFRQVYFSARRLRRGGTVIIRQR
eukprot:4254881-Pyramimonas_sp.AAC.1